MDLKLARLALPLLHGAVGYWDEVVPFALMAFLLGLLMVMARRRRR